MSVLIALAHVKAALSRYLTRKAELNITRHSHGETECHYCYKSVTLSEGVTPVPGYTFCDWTCLHLYRSQV